MSLAELSQQSPELQKIHDIFSASANPGLNDEMINAATTLVEKDTSTDFNTYSTAHIANHLNVNDSITPDTINEDTVRKQKEEENKSVPAFPSQ